MTTIKLYNGEEYPCFVTMGAFLAFSQLTGKQEADTANTVELATYLYCVAKSACDAVGREFKYSLQEFANRLEPSSLTMWAEKLVEDQAPKKKKKR